MWGLGPLGPSAGRGPGGSCQQKRGAQRRREHREPHVKASDLSPGVLLPREPCSWSEASVGPELS